MAYGDTEEAALRKAKSIALQVLADMIGSGDEVPPQLKVLFTAWGPVQHSSGSAGLAQLHVLLPRHEETGSAALAKIAKDTGLRL